MIRQDKNFTLYLHIKLKLHVKLNKTGLKISLTVLLLVAEALHSPPKSVGTFRMICVVVCTPPVSKLRLVENE